MKTLIITAAITLTSLFASAQHKQATKVVVSCNTTGVTIKFTPAQRDSIRMYVAKGFRVLETQRIAGVISGNNCKLILIKL